MELLEAFQQDWAIRALLASSMVGVMCGVLGCFIVLRNMALIGDALSHAVLPGVVFAFIIVGSYSVLGIFIGAVIAGLLSAVAMTWIQQKIKTKNDAAIGIVFTAMFSIGVIGISRLSKEEGAHLDMKDFLFGNALGVSNEDLYLTAFVCIVVLYSILFFYRHLFATTFQPIIARTMGMKVELIHYFLMLLLSFAVVASLSTVGVILVVAMLITPAATALLLSDRLKNVLFLSAVFGLMAAIMGLVLAIYQDTAPGPAMVLVATLLYIGAVFFSPKKGLLFKFLAKRKQQHKIRLEDILKQSIRLEEKEALTLQNLVDKLDINKRKVKSGLNILAQRGLFEKNLSPLKLSSIGKKEAYKLVRAHRLWETYLTQQMGLNEGQIHEDAEKYEHLLTEEVLDEMDEKLGYPTIDPHGSPIPPKE